MLWLFCVLTNYEIESQRKRHYAGDAKILAAVEKIITEEFSFVLGIDRSKVIPYILGRMKDLQPRNFGV